MKKFVCSICGYVYEGESLPADYKCPQCKAPAAKFNEVVENQLNWACQHIVGIGKEGADAEIIEGLNQNFMGECTEVGM
ncbi:MAG: NADH peroxidase, partial [Oscillospiraceae bacterium]|nr:NADH peroxidase [Oscillospiraceae bacterium]